MKERTEPMGDIHIQTPVFQMAPRSKIPGRSIYLKMECFQPVGSFKIRGIGHLCQSALDNGATHLVSSSGGNAGYAVAYAGRELGIKVTVVVPSTTPVTVRGKIEQLGAAVEVYGCVWDEAHEHALQLSNEKNSIYVPPFDDPLLWEGHATMIDETVLQCEKPDAIILSVGGGGLLCGVLEGLHRNHWEDIPVIAVETEGAASFCESVKAGKLIRLDEIKTVASSLGAKQVTSRALQWTQKHRIIPHIVTDASAVNACLNFADDFRVLVEPACGASLSLIYDESNVIQSLKSILVIVCGGIGGDIEKLLQWKNDLLD
jgi:L-serine/L-threonine ammonia-lyase